MKNYLFLVLFLIGSALSAQAQPNRFSEHEYQSVKGSSAADDAPAGGPGTDQPGGGLEGEDPEPVPIDDYLPLLMMAAIGIVFYTIQKKNAISKSFS